MPHLGKLTSLIALLGLCWSSARLEAQQPEDEFGEDITSAVNRGIKFLRQSQAPDGTWQHAGPRGEKDVGTTAFCALALLESGVDRDDPAVQKAAAVVRSRAKDLTDTYAIATTAVFLDRIGSGEDAHVILLGKKLVQGQHPTGGWSGHCPPQVGEVEDNHHASFAVLALWIARRNAEGPHKKTFEDALLRAEKRFRETQHTDGGWGRRSGQGPNNPSTPAMTCAGLLGLAINYKEERVREAVFTNYPVDPSTYRREPKVDPQIRQAREYLGKHLAQPFQLGHDAFLFFWAVERVCMMYGHPRLSGINWYSWGARNLLQLQKPSGAWEGDADTGLHCGTALALLFLHTSVWGGDIASAPMVGPLWQGPPGEARSFKMELSSGVSTERLKVILAQLEGKHGGEYTQELAASIPVVRPEIREQVQLALRRRVQRMTTDTLSAYLGGQDRELRLASLQAIPQKMRLATQRRWGQMLNDAVAAYFASKNKRLQGFCGLESIGPREELEPEALVPDLIPLLDDRDPRITAAALAMLKQLSGKDFGRDQKAWQKWWDNSKE